MRMDNAPTRAHLKPLDDCIVRTLVESLGVDIELQNNIASSVIRGSMREETVLWL